MKVTLKGFKTLDFVSNDGKKIKGTKLYVSYPGSGVTGEETASFFVPAEKQLPKITIGGNYQADFDNKCKFLGLSEA